jgi:hypothetical protein
MTAPKRSKALVAASGRDYADWFALLDAWQAPGRPYVEIAGWLTAQGLSPWWAQKLVVEYEQARGLRRAGARSDGSYSAGASKTIAASADAVYSAFTDPTIRSSWLSTPTLSQRRGTPPRSAHFDCEDEAGRLHMTVVSASSDKVTVTVEQSGLTDPTAVEQTKQHWRQRLSLLKNYLKNYLETN